MNIYLAKVRSTRLLTTSLSSKIPINGHIERETSVQHPSPKYMHHIQEGRDNDKSIEEGNNRLRTRDCSVRGKECTQCE